MWVKRFFPISWLVYFLDAMLVLSVSIWNIGKLSSQSFLPSFTNSHLTVDVLWSSTLTVHEGHVTLCENQGICTYFKRSWWCTILHAFFLIKNIHTDLFHVPTALSGASLYWGRISKVLYMTYHRNARGFGNFFWVGVREGIMGVGWIQKIHHTLAVKYYTHQWTELPTWFKTCRLELTIFTVHHF